MPKFIDLTGQRFGKFIVINRAPDHILPKGYHETMWNCKCDCGQIRSVSSKNLRSKNSTSCGHERIHRSRTELLNKRFGHLTVISFDHCDKEKDYRMYWNCKCDCGNEKIIDGHSLKRGGCNSCGHCRSIWAEPPESSERLYNVYRSMKSRCLCKTSASYRHYGGRGISVCPEWIDNYKNFKQWAYQNGYDENAPYGELTIDRIDVNGDYCPENCRWITIQEQLLNKRDTVYLTIDNCTKPLETWCKEYKIRRNTVEGRLVRGWTAKDAISVPVNSRVNKTWEKKITYNGSTKSTTEWSKITGLSPRRIRARLRSGWTVEKALFSPIKKQRNNANDHSSDLLDD